LSVEGVHCLKEGPGCWDTRLIEAAGWVFGSARMG
jgi:hypothetical protein